MRRFSGTSDNSTISSASYVHNSKGSTSTNKTANVYTFAQCSLAMHTFGCTIRGTMGRLSTPNPRTQELVLFKPFRCLRRPLWRPRRFVYIIHESSYVSGVQCAFDIIFVRWTACEVFISWV